MSEEEVPADVVAMYGVRQYPETAEFPAERGYIWNTCAATQNGNPIFWDDGVAQEVTGGPICPPTTLSLWMRPHYWSPGHPGERLALRLHFDLKARFELPEAIIGDNSIAFHEPVRPGDVISHAQILRSVSGVKTLHLGTGRWWNIDVEYTNQGGELVGVETYAGFGYRRPA